MQKDKTKHNTTAVSTKDFKKNIASNRIKKIIKNKILEKNLEEKFIYEKLGITKKDYLNEFYGNSELSSAQFLCVCIFLGLNIDDFKECFC